MSLLLMISLILSGSVAVYGVVILGVITPFWACGSAFRQKDQQMLDAIRLMKRGGAFFICGLSVVGASAFLLHQYGQL